MNSHLVAEKYQMCADVYKSSPSKRTSSNLITLMCKVIQTMRCVFSCDTYLKSEDAWADRLYNSSTQCEMCNRLSHMCRADKFVTCVRNFVQTKWHGCANFRYVTSGRIVWSRLNVYAGRLSHGC